MMMKKTESLGLNPYSYAARIFYRRLRWDLQPQSWHSRRLLRSMLGQYSGRKAVILCNGPSLLQSNLTLLDGVFAFGLNKINLMFESNPFRPSCIVSVNRLVIEQNKDFFNSTEIPLYLASSSIDLVPPRKNIVYLHTDAPQKMFAEDCSMSIYVGHTVTFVALQLAYHLGFSSVALIGCDHNFVSSGYPNQALRARGEDVNHFHPGYFADGVLWQLPDLSESEVAYKLAKRAFEEDGRQIYNATIGGKLEIFPRISIADFMALPIGVS